METDEQDAHSEIHDLGKQYAELERLQKSARSTDGRSKITKAMQQVAERQQALLDTLSPAVQASMPAVGAAEQTASGGFNKSSSSPALGQHEVRARSC